MGEGLEKPCVLKIIIALFRILEKYFFFGSVDCFIICFCSENKNPLVKNFKNGHVCVQTTHFLRKIICE